MPPDYPAITQAMAPTMTSFGQIQILPYANPLAIGCAAVKLSAALPGNLSPLEAIREFCRLSGMNRPQLILALREAGASKDPFSGQRWRSHLREVWPRMMARTHLPVLAGADLSAEDLLQFSLRRTNLKDELLARTSFRKTDLNGAQLDGACLHRADLTQTAMENASARNADLTGAYLKGADLAGADLRGARLTGADLRKTNLEGALLSPGQLTPAQQEHRPATGGGRPATHPLPAGAPGSTDAAGDLTLPHRSQTNTGPKDKMLTLTKCHDLAALARHTEVTESLATNHRGKTMNEVSCPGCGGRIPKSHGQMCHCPCGTTTAVFGNRLYHWSTESAGGHSSTETLPSEAPPPTPSPAADVLCRNRQSAHLEIVPLTERAYQTLLDAELGIAPGGADWTGEYPEVLVKAPTPTNLREDSGVRPAYRRAVTALAGMRILCQGALPQGAEHPEAVWPQTDGGKPGTE